MKIRKYQNKDYEQLCEVMDRGRMQELVNENLEQAFVSLRDAPYKKYFFSCSIYVAIIDEEVVGFVGYGRHRIEFLYLDPNYQNRGIATELMKTALEQMTRPVKISLFSDNVIAKRLYSKFGFKTITTVTEKWSREIPILYSEDTMELK